MKLAPIREHDFGATLGLSSVVVHDVKVWQCECGDLLVDGKTLRELTESVVECLLDDNFPFAGEDIRFLRKSVKLTQGQLAERLGVDRVTVTRWETGDSQVHVPESIAIRALIAAERGHAPSREGLRKPAQPHPGKLSIQLGKKVA